MLFNPHRELVGKHALVSPSKHYWAAYDDDEKFLRFYESCLAKERGTKLHQIAASLIEEGIKLPKTNQTLNRYVNDAIGYRMTPEQPLFYSKNIFGTADAISFRRNLLRVHDLKTGVRPASMLQLYVYAALFCLEYDMNPRTIKVCLRIYQNDSVTEEIPEPKELSNLMKRIRHFDDLINSISKEKT